MHVRSIIRISFLALLIGAEHLQADSLSYKKFDEVAERVRLAMLQQKIPGISLGIVHGDFELVRGFGVTNIDHPLGTWMSFSCVNWPILNRSTFCSNEETD